MTVKQNGVTFVDDVGGGGAGVDVNIVSVGGSAITKGQKTMAESFPVVLPSDQIVPIFIGQGSIPVLQIGREQNGTHISGLGPSAGFTIDQGAEIFSFLVSNTGSFIGTIRVAGAVSGTLNLIDKIYDATADVVEQTVSQFDHVYMVPCAGLDVVFLYVTIYTSGTFDFEFGAGPGSIYIPKGTQLVSTKNDLVPASPTFATVGVASAQAVAANANRKGLILVNTSANRISLGFGAAAVLDSGITLYPQGAYNMGEYDFDLGAVNAIASAAGSNLAIQEYS